MNNNDWPIHPKWLSIKKNVLESKVRPNSEGIFKPDTLKGFIADASANPMIKNPLSIFQVVPTDYDYEDYEDNARRITKIATSDSYILNILQQREIIRIDPGELFENFACCRAFRECADERGNPCTNKCFDLDCRIALLYHPNLLKNHFLKNYKGYVDTLKEIVEEYNQSLQGGEFKDYPVSCVPIETQIGGKIYKSVYLKYRCKFSDLDEFFFPVIRSGKVIAIIMQGQRPHPYLNKKNMFIDFRNNSTEEARNLESEIEKIPDEFFKKEGLSIDRKNAICQRIHALEVRIKDAVNSIAQQYVSDEFQKIEIDYRKALKSEDLNSKNPKNNLTENIKSQFSKALTDIFGKFNQNGFIRIYTRDSDVEMIISKAISFSLIGEAIEDESTDKSIDNSNLYFRSNLPQNDIEDVNTLKGYLESKASIEENDVFELKTLFGAKVGYVVWQRFKQWRNDYPSQYDLYAKSLKSIYPSLLEPYFIKRSLDLEDNLEKSMRVTVHESAQVIPSIIESINTEITLSMSKGDVPIRQVFNVKIPSYKIIDATQRLNLLERLFRNSTMIFKKDPPKFAWENIYRMVYATDSLFSQKAKLNKFQLIKIDFEQMLKYYDLFTDYGFMSHILFNLVDNAIKYGFEGSIIYVKINKIKSIFFQNKIDELRLSVISFGNRIDETEKIFDLYYRSDQAKIETEGMGLGLFIGRNLCKAMGYSMQLIPSVLMEKINLPYYYHYKLKNPEYGNKGLSENTIKQLNTLFDDKIIDEIVNKQVEKWRITKLDLEKQLATHIYKNEFVVSIPVKPENFIRELI